MINIFCDASIRQKGKGFAGCYGAICVVGDSIIDESYRVITNTTSNNAEIYAIREGILLAIRHRKRFPYVNIFSDSQVSIFGIRDRIHGWTIKNGMVYGSNGPIHSCEVYLEIMQMILDYQNQLYITFFHQKGHVDNNYKSINHACHVFMNSNNIREKVDLNFIRYISNYNNIVDRKSRSILSNTNIRNLNTRDAFEFSTTEEQFNHNKAAYKELICN